MKNLLITEKTILMVKNPSIFTLLFKGREIFATLVNSLEGCRIFKNKGKFYVESFPHEEWEELISVQCTGKSFQSACTLARSNYNAHNSFRKMLFSQTG